MIKKILKYLILFLPIFFLTSCNAYKKNINIKRFERNNFIIFNKNDYSINNRFDEKISNLCKYLFKKPVSKILIKFKKNKLNKNKVNEMLFLFKKNNISNKNIKLKLNKNIKNKFIILKVK